jgi:hypothetical protein
MTIRTTTSKRMRMGGAVAGAALLLGLGACGLQSASAPIGASGGTLTLDNGLSLEVPAGALSKPEVVGLRLAQAEAADQVDVDPAGATLFQPAVLSWSDDGRTESVVLEDGGMLPVHRQCGRAHVHVRHFGHFSCHHRGGADGGLHHDGDGRDGGSHDGNSGEGHGGDGGGEGHGGSGDGHADGGSSGHGGDRGHHDGDDDDDDDRDEDHRRLDGGCPAQRPDAGTHGPDGDGGVN